LGKTISGKEREVSVHTVYAIIQGGEVKTRLVGELEECTETGRAMFGPDASAVDVSEIPVRSGDAFRAGRFYRTEDGAEQEVRRAESFETAVAQIREEIRAVREYADIIGLATTETAEAAGVVT